MGKQKRIRAQRQSVAGMHELKSKKMPRVTINKRRGRVLTNKKKRRVLKSVAAVSVAVILGVGVFAVATFGGEANRNEVDAGFVTVSKELPTDGSKPTDHGALDNIAYMNYVFHRQTNWYSETHGTTVAAGISQSVNTWKQYDDEILVMADITYSSLVNQARQICYVGDEVLWREAANKNYDGLNTEWSTKLKGHLKLDEFVKQNGLPGTEFCVYIINEDTLLSADDVVDHGDGTYSQTYYLNPARDKAPAHYINQMIFTGGIKDADFNHITVTYTFDENWRVLGADVDESYYASMGFSVTCSSGFNVFYEYDTEKAQSNAYNDYFSQYAGQEIGGAVNDPTAMGCLGEAFGGVLSGPSVLDLKLDLNGKAIDGKICLDISDMNNIDVRAKIGDLNVWYADNRVYLSYQGMKLRLSVDEFMGIFNELLPEQEEGGGEEKDLLSSIFVIPDDGFTFDETSARLKALLSFKELGVNLELPVDFAFALEKQTDSNNRVSYKVTLKDVTANADFGGFTIGASLAFGEGTLPALAEGEKAEFIELMPYVNSLVELLSGESIRVKADYAQNGLCVSGDLNVSLQPLCVSGKLNLKINDIALAADVIFENNTVYLKAGDLKVKAGVDEIAELVKDFGVLPQMEFDLFGVAEKLLSLDFGKLAGITENGSTLALAINGTELLKALLGESAFDLGEILINVNENGLWASALGAEISVSKGGAFSADTQGYADLAPYFPYVKTLADMFSSELIRAELVYGTEGGVRVSGGLNLSLRAGFAAEGAFEVTLPATETEPARVIPVFFAYADGFVYLDAMGAKLKLDPASALPFLSQSSFDLSGITQKLFTPEFNQCFEVSADGSLQVVVHGTELLSYLGLGEFELGDLTLAVDGDSLTASGLGVTAVMTGAQGRIAAPEGDYRDATAAVTEILNIISSKRLSFSGELGLNVNSAELALTVKNASVCWENGIRAVLNTTLTVGGTQHDLSLEATDAGIKLAYGNVGVKFAYGDLTGLESALTELYNYIAEKINAMSEGGDALAAVDSVEGIVDSVKGLISLFGAVQSAKTAGAEAFSLDPIALIKMISLSNPENGLLRIDLGQMISVTLSEGAANHEKLSAEIVCNLNGIRADAKLFVTEFVQAEMPAVDYLGAEELKELLNFIKAGVQTIFAQTLSATVSGTTYSEDTAAYPDGIKNEFTAQIEYYAGSSGLPVHFDLSNRNFYVDTDLYMHLTLALDNRAEGQDDLYLDVWVLDWSRENGEDGVLDLYVNLSRMGGGSGALCLHITADQLVTVAASALAMLGIDNEFLNDLIVNARLDLETTDALRAVGERLKKSIGFEDVLGSLFGGSAQTGAVKLGEGLRGYISSLKVDGERFEIVLDSSLLFGGEGLGNFAVTLTKTENGLTGVSLKNIYAEGGKERTDVSVNFAYGEIAQTEPVIVGEYYELDGIAELFGSLAKSATHYGSDGKAYLNDYFYVDGSLSLSASLGAISIKNLNIPLRLSVKVAEDGNVSANAYLKLPALKILTYEIIRGETETFFTLDKGMIYIRRVQTTDASGKKLARPEEIYRVMPLSVFGAQAMDQIGFMFNLDSSILSSMQGDGSGSSLDLSGDYGTVARSLITSCVYLPSESGNSWELKLNGKTFASMLSDIAVTLRADSEGIIRNLDLGTELTVYGITISLSGSLNYCNPRGETAVDKTQNVAGMLSGAMSKAIREADAAGWKKADGTPYFAEGRAAVISYVLGGIVMGTQTVVFDNETKELYADLLPPDLSGIVQAGYSIVWELPQDHKVPASLNVYGRTQANRYTVMLESEKPLDGFTLGENGLYTIMLTYVFDDGFYTASGDRFEFPAQDFGGERVAAFGNELFSFENFDDCTQILSDTTLRAQWQPIEYRIEYVSDGETLDVQNAYYGDAYSVPAAQKTGHRFLGWFDGEGKELSGNVTGNKTFTAKFEAETFTVTLFSEHYADGFQAANGGYERVLSYTYGETLTLPTGEYGNLFLKGYRNGNGEIVSEIGGLLEDSSLVAVWTEISVIVTFLNENGEVYATLNCEKGEPIGEYALPSVPVKEGHTGEWNLRGDETVLEGLTVRPVYTANSYTVSIFSEYAVQGFAADGSGYVYNVTAKYGETIALPQGLKVPKFDFGGIYTQSGERVESVTVSGDIALSVRWMDNTVTVNLLSDVRFDDAVWNNTASAYCKSVSFNDDYSFSYAPAVSGYQQLGWWYAGENGWQTVSDVRGLNGARIWAVWIQDIEVTITDFYTNSYLGGSQYNIGGYVTGGRVAGNMSESIFNAVGMTETMDAKYMLYGPTPSKNDNPGGSRVDKLTYGDDGKALFFGQSMNSSDFSGILWVKKAEYGGIDISKTFTYAGGAVTTSQKAIVTLETYTVNFINGNDGKTFETVTKHHKVTVSGNSFVIEPVLLEEIAPQAPEFAGYRFLGWDKDGKTEIGRGSTVNVTARYEKI